jgi:hypothetical protein
VLDGVGVGVRGGVLGCWWRGSVRCSIRRWVVFVGLVGMVLVLVLVGSLFDLLALVLVSWACSSLYSIASALFIEVGGGTGSCW